MKTMYSPVGLTFTMSGSEGGVTMVKTEAVRMILWDDTADGCVRKLDMQFPSISEAVLYRDSYMLDVFDGHIETLDGEIIRTLQKDQEEYDWSEHECRCEGCTFCNPTAFRDED